MTIRPTVDPAKPQPGVPEPSPALPVDSARDGYKTHYPTPPNNVVPPADPAQVPGSNDPRR
jgi:hypothetical protein